MRPELFVVPNVFADGDAERLVGEGADVLRMGGLKVTALVEDVVSGQEHLALDELDVAVADQRGAVGDGLAGVVLGAADVTDDGGEGDFTRQEIELFKVAFDEGGTLDEIERW